MELFGKQFKPMLASKAEVMDLEFPICATPKIDGIRCVLLDGVAYSRSMKPIRSKKIQSALSGLPSGLDGELICTSGGFQESTSVVMSETSDLPWKYQVFDYLDPSNPAIEHYLSRMRVLQEMQELGKLNEHCEVLYPEVLHTLDCLLELCQEHLQQGFEGTMVRDPKGGYKFGRSTKREGLLLKIKEFEDDEAVVVGTEELLHNLNEATTNELGLTDRSSHKENKQAGGTLGALVVQLLEDKTIEFKIGTGFTASQRAELWAQRQELIGKIVKFKHFPIGVKTRPRHPTFIGFRSLDDM